MRLGWTKNKNSTTYRALKTIRVDGKNRTLVVKTFGSDNFICETYGVTDAKAWAREQVRIMDDEEKKEEPSFEITLHSGADLPPDARRCFGSLTLSHLEITCKASNGFIFLSKFKFCIARYL